jgi:hypothetical protein
MCDVKQYDCVIIRRGKEYLVALSYSDTLCLRWSVHYYDGIQFKRQSIGYRIAKMLGGEIVYFNPITGVIGHV